jgi:hypothetical protein
MADICERGNKIFGLNKRLRNSALAEEMLASKDVIQFVELVGSINK